MTCSLRAGYRWLRVFNLSYRAFVVCEDHTLDQYIAVPVINALLTAVGRPHARVRAVTDPRTRGIEDVISQFASLSERYAGIGQLVVFTLDTDGRDGSGGGPDRAAQMENLRRGLPNNVSSKVLIILGRQELEVWALWASRSVLSQPWSTVRLERDPKDVYLPQVLTPADKRLPGRGRSRLIQESLATGWDSLAQGCPELAEAEQDLRTRSA